MSDSVRPHRRQSTRIPHPWDSPGKNTGVGCHYLLQCMKLKSESEVAQSCLTLCDPMDCSLPGSSVHGIFKARVLEWVAISFSRGYSQPRNWIRVSWIAGEFFTTEKPPLKSTWQIIVSHKCFLNEEQTNELSWFYLLWGLCVFTCLSLTCSKLCQMFKFLSKYIKFYFFLRRTAFEGTEQGVTGEAMKRTGT